MMSIGQTALVSILSHFIFIYITWRVILKMNFDLFFQKGRTTEVKIFLIFLAIVIGTGVSHFFLDILQWSRDLIYLF